MHMNQKSKLVMAAVVVAVMLLLVVVFGYRERPETVAGADTPWLPQLKQQLAEVRRIRLRSSAEVATLERTTDGWGVVERGGYAADFRQLEAMLEALATARRVEQKTAKPEFFERLGLSDIEQPASEAVQLEIWAAGDEPIVNVLLGKPAQGRGGRYVRAVADNQTWLIDTAPETMTNPADWIERALLGVDFARVASVARVVAGKTEFTAARASAAGDASLAAAELPAGKVPRYLSVFDTAARAILTAEAEDARKAAELDFSAAAETLIACFDGLRITVRALKDQDGSWVTLAAEAGEPLAALPPSPDAAQELAPDEQAPAAKAADPAAAQAEAARLNASFAGWAFKVSDYVYGELAKGLGDYIQDEKPGAGAGTAESSGEHD